MNTKRSRYLSATVSAVLSLAAAATQAGPQNGTVTQGAATISTPATNITQIDQTTNSVSIDWQSFDVAANESVNFNQPSASSVAMNRILTQDPSQILGSINANGRVFLLNPNGIIFGASARVNVGSLVASSLDLTDVDATAGRYSFGTSATQSGAIINNGTLTAANGGTITLLGASVLNTGLIVADYGTVNLGAGRAATLSFDGDGLMRFQIDAGLLTDSSGAQAAVDNSGQITADGGQVLLTAQQAGDVVARAVNNDGVIRASRVENTGGVIRLVGSGGTVVNSGTLDATGSNGTGGEIAVLGENVTLTGTAVVDVSGTHGGGTAFVGGGFAGADPALLNAQNTTVDAGAVIRADSTQSGDAGRVAVWSEGRTTFNGDILARAGGASGNGGFAEVSGRQNLRIGGHATLTSENGTAGSMLLDPGMINIVDGNDAASAADNEIGDEWIIAQLGTPGTLTISTAVYGDGSPSTLTVDSGAEITWSTASTLELIAGSAISFEAGSIVRSTDSDGSLVVSSGAGVDFAGTLDLAGNLSVTAGADITQAAAIEVGGTTSLTTAAGSSILLGNPGNSFGGAVTLAAVSGNLDDVTLYDTTALTLDPLTIDGNLTLMAAGITTAALEVGGDLSFTSTGALTQSGAVSAGSLTFVSDGAVTLGADATTTGALTVTAGAGINQIAGAIAVAGDATFTAAGGSSINVAQATNLFDGAIDFNAASGTLQSVSVSDTTTLQLQALDTTGNLTVNAASIDVSGAVNVGGNASLTTTAGGISQTGALTVDGTTMLSATGQAITLTNAGNDFAGSVGITAASAQLSDSNAIILGASSLTGALGISSAGSLAQSGALNVDGDVTLNTGTGTITLDNAANDFGGTVRVTAAGDTNLRNAAPTVLGASTITGGLNVTSAGAITQTGTLSVSGAANFTTRNDAGAAITLGAANSFGSVGASVLNAAGTADAVAAIALNETGDTVLSGTLRAGTGAAVAVTSSGSITQTGALTTAANATFTAGDGESITLGEANTFGGSVSFVGNGGNLDDVTVRDTTALDLSALTISGDLVATGASLSQSGGLSVGGTATFTADQGSTLLFNRPDNALQGAVSFASNGPGALQAVTLQNSIATNLGASTVGGDFSATATTGNITQSGELSVGGNLALTATAGSISQTAAMNITGNSTFTAATGQSITLGQANTFTGSVGFAGNGGNLANVTIRDSDALTLQSLSVSNDLTATAASIEAQALIIGGDLNLTATAGDITQTAAMNVTGNSTFTADAGQSILLGQANTFTGTVTFVGNGGNLNDVALTDSDAINLQALALDGDLNVTTTSGAITQSGAIEIGGTSTFTAATGQSISLVDPDNDFTGIVTFLGSGGNLADVSVRDTSALTLGGLTLSGNLSVNADSIAQSGTLVIGGGSTFTASGGQSIDLDNPGNTFTGMVGFAARSGTLQDVSITDTTALDLQALAIGGDLTASASSLTQSGALSVGGTATLTSGTDIALNTTSANALILNAGGAITQVGDLSIANTTTINAGGQNVTLDRSNNAFGGSIAVTASTASLTNSVATTLAASTLGSSLIVDSAGAINQTGAINVVGGNTSLTSDAGVTLAAINTGTLTVGAGGAVTQSGGALNVTGNSTITASGQNVTLNAANTFGGSVAVTAANAELTNNAVTTLGASTIANDLTVVSTGALNQSAPVSVGSDAMLTGAGVMLGALSAGTLTVNSSAAVGQTGAISVAGNSTFNAAGQDVALTAAGNSLGGGVALTAATASLSNSTATTLQASTLTGNLTVNSTGALTQSGALNVGGTTTLAAAGQNITLGDTANTFGGGVAVTGANVTLVDADSIDLRASTVSGDLAVTAVAGTITQSGALNVTGNSTFTAADGQSILLTDATNIFGGVRLASSGQLDNVSLAAASSLDLQGLDIAGDLAVTTGGSLTQSATLIVAGDADFRTLNGGSHIALNGANQFGSVSATGAGGVSITQGMGDLNLRQVTAAGAARLEATSGSIIDDAADPSAATVSAASVELVALNNIGTVTDLLTRQGTAIAVNTNGGALAARVSNANGQINLALPGGSAPTAAAGAISAGGAARLLIQSAGDLSLNAFNSAITGFSEVGFSADGTLSMPGAQADLIAGPLATLYLRGATDIARADRTFNLSASHLIFDSGSQGGDVTLNTSADRLDASVGGSASLTVQNTGDLTLGTVSAANNVTIGAANLRDDGDANGVTRVSAGNTIALNASASIGEADGMGGGRIDTASSTVTLNASAGPVYLSHAGDLQVSGDAGSIEIVTPTGNITVASTLRANGPLTLVAGTEGAVTGNIMLTGTAQSTGTATLTAANGGTIADASDAATHLVAQAANLSAAAIGSQANALSVEVGTLNATVGGDLHVNATNAIRLGTIAATSASIGASGAIADDGDNATRITAQSLTLAGAAVGAAGAGNEIDTAVDSLSATASAGGIYIGESGDAQLGALNAAGNDIVVTAAGAILDDGDHATRISGGNLTLNATSIGAAGAGLDTQVSALDATASNGGVFINEADDLQINSVSGTEVVLTAGGALTDDGNDATRVTGTNVSLTAARIGTADNRIDTAAGSLSAIANAGGIFAAEQDDVALTEVRASGTGNTVDLRTGGNGNMTVQTLVTQGGAVTLTSGGTGSITVTGAIESNNGVVSLISGNALALPGLDTGTGSVTLRTVNDLNVGTITSSSVSITSDNGNVSLGTIDASGGTVTVTANNGTITDGDTTSLTARDATLTARAIGGPDQALNLAVDNLTATASAGGIYINDIDGLALNAINANGVVSIVTTGALTQNAAIVSGGSDIEIFADSIAMRAGATTLSGNGNISYVANNGAVSLEALNAGTGRALVIASDSVYSTLDPNSGINNLSGSVVEIRAGGLFGGAGEIGTMSNPISIATPGSSGRSVYLIVPATNGIQSTTPSINYLGSSASLLLKGYTGSTGVLLFDLSSTFSPETILSGGETIVPLQNGRVAVNSDSLSAAKQALSSGVVARINVDWAAFDPNVSLFGTLDPSLRLPADQVDEEVPTASLIPEGTVLQVSREGWVLKRAI